LTGFGACFCDLRHTRATRGHYINPDRLSHEELAADLTNNFIPGVIATPGNEGMIGKFEESGFVYSHS
jgi:hypothetical protein